jgi:hypothetical protein
MLEKAYPDHHDAELVLRMYELRRDPVMRESREKLASQFWPRSYDDVKAVAGNRQHPLNSAFRQVSTYWEMVYGMAKHGIVHADFLADSNGEGMYLLAKMQPYLEEHRRDSSPRAFQNAEWLATHSDTAKALLEHFTARVKKTLESK